MKIIGSGNTGIKIALMFDKEALLLSTAEQDTNNYSDSKNIVSIAKQGASKRFKTGLNIWEENIELLQGTLKHIRNDYVIIFSSLGGGSGSSSLNPISNILLEQNNKILIVGILPYKAESNPPLANSVQSLNNIFPLLNDVSVILFDNTELVKMFNSDWNLINHFIVKRIDYMINLLSKYNKDGYSPITIDQSELYSVIFGGGFVDFSESFLEETFPEFGYGKMTRTTKNCLIAMFVNDKIIDKMELEKYHTILTEVVTKITKKIPNSRIIPGILRAELNKSNSQDETIIDRGYFTIASGLNVDTYLRKINKLKEQAIKKVKAYNERSKKVKLKNSEMKMLDI